MKTKFIKIHKELLPCGVYQIEDGWSVVQWTDGSTDYWEAVDFKFNKGDVPSSLNKFIARKDVQEFFNQTLKYGNFGRWIERMYEWRFRFTQVATSEKSFSLQKKAWAIKSKIPLLFDGWDFSLDSSYSFCHYDHEWHTANKWSDLEE